MANNLLTYLYFEGLPAIQLQLPARSLVVGSEARVQFHVI